MAQQDAIETQEKRLSSKQDGRRLQRVDRLIVGNTHSQIGRTIAEPVTGRAERDNFDLPENEEQEVILRNAQWAYTFVASKCGFDSDWQVNPATGRPLNVQDPNDFQMYYELARKWTAQETKALKEQFTQEGRFFVTTDPLTDEALPDDSLMLLWQLHQQKNPNNSLNEEKFDSLKNSYQQLCKAYGPKLSMETVYDAAKKELYMSTTEELFNRAIESVQTQALFATRSLLHASRYTSSIARELQDNNSTTRTQLPHYIDQAIAKIEAAGIYVPIRDGETDPPQKFGSGSLKRLQLAIELAEGGNRDAIRKAQEEKQQREIERQLKEEHVRQRRENHAREYPVTEEVRPQQNTQKSFGLLDRAKGLFARDIQPEEYKGIITSAGLNPEEVLTRWKYASYREDRDHSDSETQKYIQKNIKALQDLEKTRPDCAKTLLKEFGIVNFARYPIEMLIDQYDNRDRNDAPYGIVMNPIADWNGSFVYDKKTFQKLHKKTNGHFQTRIVEVDGRMDVAKNLLSLRKRYSTDISYAIIGGHGTTDSIDLGTKDTDADASKTKHQLRIEDLLGHGTQAAGEFFAPNATIILNSCSTGDERVKNIASVLSERTNLTVFAPQYSINSIDFAITISNGQISLVPIYDREARYTKAYRGGKHIKDVDQLKAA